jgi:hypothetical protein
MRAALPRALRERLLRMVCSGILKEVAWIALKKESRSPS